MNDDALNQFSQERKTVYQDESYLVRDNGAICRQPRPDKWVRRYDSEWTFGNKIAAGYRYLSRHAVHRVVATAFHGNPPSKNHVVDHIDTNRENNRPENLRWVTRAENLYENPITLKRIESIWGSVELMLNYFKNVSPDVDSESLTPMAMQRRWRIPCEFPLCPEITAVGVPRDIDQEVALELLQEYAEDLEFGSTFCRNTYGESITVQAVITKPTGNGIGPSLIVLSTFSNNNLKSWSTTLAKGLAVYRFGNNIKDWAVAQVTIESGVFIHENQHAYITLRGALKAYCELAGIPFDHSIDDDIM